MNNPELRQQRAKLFRDATLLEAKPSRVPHLSYYVTWMIFDSGYKLKEAVSDYKKMEQTVIDHAEKYRFDAISYFGTRNPYLISKTFGAEYYQFDDEAGSINIQAYELLHEDELSLIAKDPIKTLWEVCLPRKFENFNKDTSLDLLQKVFDEKVKFESFKKQVIGRITNEYDNPAITDGTLGGAYFGIEYLFSMLRGIKGVSVDMRRHPQELIDASEALDAIWVQPHIDKLAAAGEGPNMSTCWDTSLCFLAHTIMNSKQFEKFYWPKLKQVCDLLGEKKKTSRIIFEGWTEPQMQFLEDYPKATFTFSLEQDNIFEMKKKYPQFAYCGGMPCQLMGSGSKEEVIDYAKKLINEVGVDGGYVMSLDKMGSFRNDSKSENLKALCDFMMDEQ